MKDRKPMLPPMFAVTDNTIRLFLHLLGATVWVGGQIVVGGLMPTLRKLGPDVPRQVARAFGRVAWPALALVLGTGIWNALVVDVSEQSSEYSATFGIKMTFFMVTAGGALAHVLARGNKRILAVGGAMASLGAAGTLFLGVLLGTQGT